MIKFIDEKIQFLLPGLSVFNTFSGLQLEDFDILGICHM